MTRPRTIRGLQALVLTSAEYAADIADAADDRELGASVLRMQHTLDEMARELTRFGAPAVVDAEAADEIAADKAATLDALDREFAGGAAAPTAEAEFAGRQDVTVMGSSRVDPLIARLRAQIDSEKAQDIGSEHV